MPVVQFDICLPTRCQICSVGCADLGADLAVTMSKLFSVSIPADQRHIARIRTTQRSRSWLLYLLLPIDHTRGAWNTFQHGTMILIHAELHQPTAFLTIDSYVHPTGIPISLLACFRRRHTAQNSKLIKNWSYSLASGFSTASFVDMAAETFDRHRGLPSTMLSNCLRVAVSPLSSSVLLILKAT